MNNDNRSELHVSNPITKSCERPVKPPGLKLADYTALAMSVDKISRCYIIAIVKSKQILEHFYQWGLLIHIYDSKTTMVWEFDDVFASSGMDDLIYIQSFGASALLVFDMNQKQWKWSNKCPVTKRFPLQLFKAFCFEQRLEIAR
ncbi:hypothetical protein Nepgr_019124 [Nepenthes gracilis]|uniref:Uncharacterized protein n=1 Tax=Nepenthes gracilis TaxID=150966 RepID=A0AAD3SSN5_NEPGR|nr:hypothetical protein Nepgr_019124 [Nepenthes gracilis]